MNWEAPSVLRRGSSHLLTLIKNMEALEWQFLC
jgi:hypothetical protein